MAARTTTVDRAAKAPPKQQAPKRRKRPLWQRLRHDWPLVLLTLPAMVQLAIFFYTPSAYSVIAFMDYSPYRPLWENPIIGFTHFQILFNDPYFVDALLNTLKFALAQLMFVFPISIGLALVMHSVVSTKMRSMFQSIVYLPYFFSWVLVVSVFTQVLGEGGLVSRWLLGMGGDRLEIHVGKLRAHVFLANGPLETRGNFLGDSIGRFRGRKDAIPVEEHEPREPLLDERFHARKLRRRQRTGYAQGLFVDPFNNLREDTDGDGIPNGEELRIGTDPFRSTPAALELCSRHQNLYAAVGVHPHEAAEVNGPETWRRLEQQAAHPKVVALGETSGEEAVRVGDWVLIHVGFAMSRIDEAEAAETLRALKLFTDVFEGEMLEFSADGELDPLTVLGPTATSPRLLLRHSASEQLEVCIDHQTNHLLEACARLPAELLARLAGVADQVLDLGRAHEARVDPDMLVGLEPGVLEGQLDGVMRRLYDERMRLTGSPNGHTSCPNVPRRSRKSRNGSARRSAVARCCSCSVASQLLAPPGPGCWKPSLSAWRDRCCEPRSRSSTTPASRFRWERSARYACVRRTTSVSILPIPMQRLPRFMTGGSERATSASWTRKATSS
jgi:hydrogenase assembly chaperone HypC/HupF